MIDTPYIGFGNDTLNRQARLRIGDLVMFYRCGEKQFLAGVAGRSVLGVPSDVRGSL
jgi:hypothetical protein